MEWTEERVALLTEFWTSGLWARQIAERLGSVTRNAVIGKANRLGLSQPTKSSVTRRKKREEQEQKQATVVVDPPPGEGVSILTLTNMSCRWPIGHPGEEDFRFCGARTIAGQPYCAGHAKLAYQPATAKESKRRTA